MAKPWLPASMSDAEAERVLDGLLDEDPESVYRHAAQLAEARWPLLAAALAGCTDVEARLLLAAEPKARPQVAQFAALIAQPSNCPACAKKVVGNPLARTRGVLAACAQVMKSGYPPFRVALAGLFAALVTYGESKQVKALLAVHPPDDALLWMRAVCRRLPKPRAAPFLALIADREERDDSPDEPPRYTRRFAAEELPRPRAPNQVAAPAEALAAVYASPLLDAPRAVLADFLLEQQEPLGEFIQLQLTRAKGKRGTLKRERELFELHKAQLWPDHPVGLADAHLDFEDTERGFPWKFGNAFFPNEAVFQRLARHPGWATIRSFRGSERGDLAELLPVQLPQLERLTGVSLENLNAVRDRAWPVKELSVAFPETERDRQVQEFTGFQQLRTLEVLGATDVLAALTALEPTGLLGRITELQVRTRDEALSPMLEGFARLPAQVSAFTSSGYPYPVIALRRAGKSLDVTIEVEDAGLENMLEQLAGLNVSRVASLEFVLATNGFFTKKTRPVAEQASRKVLARFKKARLTSKHPT